MLKKLALISIYGVSAFALHTAEININDKDLELSAKFDMGQFNDNVEPNTIFVGGKFLKGDEKNSEPNNANIDPYLEANFLVKKEIGNRGLSFGMGVKANYTKNYASIPLGAEFGFKIPAQNLIPMYLNGAIYYAPTVLCFNDAKDFVEYRISYDIEVIENAMVTLGYRQLNTNYDTANNSLGDYIYNNSWFIGFKFSF